MGAAVTYAIGRFLGQDFVRKIAGAKWRRLEQKIRQTGIVAVTTLRLLPIAPFTVVNIISGAFKVPLRDYILGSLLGLLPGILITNLFAHQFTSAIRDPGIGAFLVLASFDHNHDRRHRLVKTPLRILAQATNESPSV